MMDVSYLAPVFASTEGWWLSIRPEVDEGLDPRSLYETLFSGRAGAFIVADCSSWYLTWGIPVLESLLTERFYFRGGCEALLFPIMAS